MLFQRILACNYLLFEKILKILKFWCYRDFLYIKSTDFLWRLRRTFQILDTSIIPTDILQNKSLSQWSKTRRPCFQMKRYFLETQLLCLDFWHYIYLKHIQSKHFSWRTCRAFQIQAVTDMKGSRGADINQSHFFCIPP